MVEKSDLLDLEVTIVSATDKAIRVDTSDITEPVWLPRSQVEIETDREDEIGQATITLPKWLAENRGLA